MADALVGGAFLSAFLQVLFDRMASRELISFFRTQKLDDALLRQLKTTFMAFNVVLDDAEEKQIINPTVKAWLNELKDATYEAEDLLDEIATEALRCKLEAESHATTDQNGVLLKIAALKYFRIEGCNVLESFLEKLRPPSPLTCLSIWSLSCMKFLDSKEPQNLTPPEQLKIYSCSRLHARRMASHLPFCLTIEECPFLKQQCQREKGEYWPKISHVYRIKIDDQVIL